MAKTINVTLGGKSYALPPLALGDVAAIRRRLHDRGSMPRVDFDVLRLAWPRDAEQQLDAIEGATHTEVTAAAEEIIAAAGLTRTAHNLAWLRAQEESAA
jgi:hypothetical protein